MRDRAGLGAALTLPRRVDMRRRLSSLLLAFCMVFSQQGALLHALRHELPRAGAVSDDIDPHPAGTVCVICLAFASIAGVVTSTVVAPLLSLEFHWSADVPFAYRPADAPPTRARGPPAFF